jgi:hypothetical protein
MVRPGGCLYQPRVGPLSWTFARPSMPNLPLDPDVADTAPSDSVLTVYDEEHVITYLRMLDANAEGADWREVTRMVLHLDPDREPDRARKGVRKPFVAPQMNERSRLSATAARWRVR